MKILLVGEYSRLHNSLKEGLLELGHEAVILGMTDGFKDYPVDFKIERKWNTGWRKKLVVGIFKISGFDITSLLTYRQFWKIRRSFTEFDVVQLINENSFSCTPQLEQKILKYLFANNKKTFLLCCGSDYLSTKYEFESNKQKSIVRPYLERKIQDKNFLNVLKFRTPEYAKLHEFIYKNSAGIIASDMDYHLALNGNPKYLGLIPNPVNSKKLQFNAPNSDKIHIFHGINDESFYLKGSDYFEKALEIVKQRFGDAITVTSTRSLPYRDYIKVYDACHILLDQVYAYDQGYNALEAMAKGKVVFTGAEKEFYAYYNLSEKVAINAVPDVEIIVEELAYLIENPDEIKKIAAHARKFIESEHNYIAIAQKYVDTWATR